MAGDALIDHLERTYADSYRKEIDQEENVWRSLPFFAATLALQLAALAQMRDWIAGIGSPASFAASLLLAASGTATIAAIVFLALSVWPADYRRVASEPAFLDYAERVRLERAMTMPETLPRAVAEIALTTVKATLTRQYAVAVTYNRKVNERRSKWRTLAGLASLGSVLAMMVLVALVVLRYLHDNGQRT